VLRDIDVCVQPGATVLVYGPNGSGKTTLLRVLSSALSPTAGTVEVLGRAAAESRANLALLSHADGHYDELSGRDNLELAKELGNLPGEIAATLERVGLAARADDPVRAYSAGMRKRLAFARLLLKSPRVVFLDEPYAALDPSGHDFVDGLLGEFHQAGATVLVSTHQVARVAALSTDAIQLQGGKIAWTGLAAEAVRSRLAPSASQVSEDGSAEPTGPAG
jgi:heme exporter protein A